jgi:hypothetical protein
MLHTDRIERGFVLWNKVLVAEVFAKNGFLVLDSITGEEQTAEANADRIDQDEGGGDSGHQSMTTNKKEDISKIEAACKAEL